jgi:mono/diheme cytochrome c family protein
MPTSARSAALRPFVVAALLGGVLAAGCAKQNDSADASAPASASPAQSTQAQADASHGAELFGKVGCASCHAADGSGGVGPNLHGERHKKNLAAAIAWIENPQPPMPKLYPSPLSTADVRDVAAYVETL